MKSEREMSKIVVLVTDNRKVVKVWDNLKTDGPLVVDVHFGVNIVDVDAIPYTEGLLEAIEGLEERRRDE